MKKILAISALALLLIPAFSFINTISAQRFDKLGERKVNFKTDRDAISGWRDGFYRALKIKVTTVLKLLSHCSTAGT